MREEYNKRLVYIHNGTLCSWNDEMMNWLQLRRNCRIHVKSEEWGQIITILIQNMTGPINFTKIFIMENYVPHWNLNLNL